MISLTNAFETLASLAELGGPVVAIIMVISAVSLAVILLKFWQFFRMGVGRRARAEKAVGLWLEGRPREALALAREGRSAAARAVALAIQLRTDRRAEKAEIEERIARDVTERFHDLQSGFRFLDAVAQVAPLLGLFGTVLGMIDAFRQLQTAGNAVDPSILAGGIWVALLTTAAGLAVAMPVSLVLTWLETRIESERVAVETLTADVLGTRPSIEPHNPSAPRAGEAALAG
ncbi:MAG: flagellar motor protein MotA [Rhizobiales bacterium]|nr:flagellar motor protein MotA [Hyphomicrobiales bacterium]MBA70856.1 flagellar motor protein MotA [Hyphomicrobiales bacterium]